MLKHYKVGTNIASLDYGDWSDWKSCPTGYAISAMQHQIEPYQGSSYYNDDTALNGVRFRCTEVPVNTRMIYHFIIKP